MKKVAIVTINDYDNYGNRLQNYAVQQILKKKNLEVETIQNLNGIYRNNYKKILKNKIGNAIKKISFLASHKRYNYFMKFNKNIKLSKFIMDKSHLDYNSDNYYDFFLVGSDQVWNPNASRLTDFELLSFVSPQKRVAFSASFGVSKLDSKYHNRVKNELLKYKAISVREDDGKKIVEEITSRTDVEVLIDPTMMLNSDEWDCVLAKPKHLKNNKYILNYFLGNLSDDKKNEINRIAEENNCEIIDILNKESPFYQTGPSEFLYLEKNAFLICTDSFHSSVFAILYNTPVVVFERDDCNVDMSSRLNTLLKKFKLDNRKYVGKITEDLLKCDYEQAYYILEEERKKVDIFLKKSLDL